MARELAVCVTHGLSHARGVWPSHRLGELEGAVDDLRHASEDLRLERAERGGRLHEGLRELLVKCRAFMDASARQEKEHRRAASPKVALRVHIFGETPRLLG